MGDGRSAHAAAECACYRMHRFIALIAGERRGDRLIGGLAHRTGGPGRSSCSAAARRRGARGSEEVVEFAHGVPSFLWSRPPQTSSREGSALRMQADLALSVLLPSPIYLLSSLSEQLCPQAGGSASWRPGLLSHDPKWALLQAAGEERERRATQK
jgi:hypothetical protein